jgi:hypothetical protein
MEILSREGNVLMTRAKLRAVGGRLRSAPRMVAGAVRPVHLLVVLAFVLAVGGAAIASSTSTATIRGCVNKKTHVLTVPPKKTKSCGKHATTLNWNATGPAGPRGAAGATGATGATGSQGAAGTSVSGGLPPSASGSTSTAVALTGTLAPIVTANITTTQPSRIEENTVAVLSVSVSGTITCEAQIAPQSGGSSSVMGNAITVDSRSGGSAEGNAGGAITEPAGSYTVSLDCDTTGTASATSADMNVITGAP